MSEIDEYQAYKLYKKYKKKYIDLQNGGAVVPWNPTVARSGITKLERIKEKCENDETGDTNEKCNTDDCVWIGTKGKGKCKAKYDIPSIMEASINTINGAIPRDKENVTNNLIKKLQTLNLSPPLVDAAAEGKPDYSKLMTYLRETLASSSLVSQQSSIASPFTSSQPLQSPSPPLQSPSLPLPPAPPLQPRDMSVATPVATPDASSTGPPPYVPELPASQVPNLGTGDLPEYPKPDTTADQIAALEVSYQKQRERMSKDFKDWTDLYKNIQETTLDLLKSVNEANLSSPVDQQKAAKYAELENKLTALYNKRESEAETIQNNIIDAQRQQDRKQIEINEAMQKIEEYLQRINSVAEAIDAHETGADETD